MPLINRCGGGGVDASGANALPSQVLKGNTFIGAAGSLETGTLGQQTKSVVPSSVAQTVYPDSGYLLSAVTVGAIPDKQIYKGTLTYDIMTMPSILQIDVGVPIDETAMFVMLPDNVTDPYGNYEVFAAGRLSKDMRFILHSDTDSATGLARLRMSSDISHSNYTASAFVNYSGTVVTVGDTSSSMPFADAGTYTWYLLQ